MRELYTVPVACPCITLVVYLKILDLSSQKTAVGRSQEEQLERVKLCSKHQEGSIWTELEGNDILIIKLQVDLPLDLAGPFDEHNYGLYATEVEGVRATALKDKEIR